MSVGDSDLRWFPEDGLRHKDRFAALLGPLLRPGMRILDVGAGRDPTLGAAARPPGAVYVGMDEDPGELERAAGFYDQTIEGDITRHDPSLDGSFDLVVSWQVFEHVRAPRDAYRNIHRYLKPGGHYAGRLTGRYALFAMMNRVLPMALTRWLLVHLTGRKPDSVFRAFYQDATLGRLRDIFGSWEHYEIRPEFDGREYFEFSRVAAAANRLYLRFARRDPRLASYYTVLARKARPDGSTQPPARATDR